VDTQDFERTWSELNTERAALVDKRTNLENELAEIRTKLLHLDEVLIHLGPLANLTGDIVGLGLTDAIRYILQGASPDKLSAQDIRQRLSDGGCDLSQLSAPMSSIYKVLSRLEGQEVDREKDGPRVFWKWKTSSPITDEDIPF